MNDAEIVKWKAWIAFLVSEAPEDDTSTIPEIAVYPTLLDSLCDNTNTEMLKNEEMAERFFKKDVWTYAILVEGASIKTGRKINLCINRIKDPQRNIPLEVNFFHEIGHFNVMRKRYPQKVYLESDEDECDYYALVEYLKLLKKYPSYKTITPNKGSSETEEFFKKYLEIFPCKMSVEDIAKKLKGELKWGKQIVKTPAKITIASQKLMRKSEDETPAKTQTSSKTDKINLLKREYSAGILTDDEFKVEYKRIVAS